MAAKKGKAGESAGAEAEGEEGLGSPTRSGELSIGEGRRRAVPHVFSCEGAGESLPPPPGGAALALVVSLQRQARRVSRGAGDERLRSPDEEKTGEDIDRDGSGRESSS